MTRLCILSQLFYPELVSTGQTLTELAEALQDLGMQVSVYCGYPTMTHRHDQVPKQMVHQGIQIRRLWGTRFPKLSFWGKLLNHLTFSASVVWRLLWDTDRSPLLVSTNPPMLPVLAAVVCVLKKRPYVSLVFDVYPETAVIAGVLSERGILASMWRGLQSFALSHADWVVVIGRCMEKRILPYLRDPSRMVHIPVWADDHRIQSDTHEVAFPWVEQGKIVVGYSGNMARFHDMETLVAAAEVLKEDPRFVFVCVGDGYKKAFVGAAAARLPNLQCHAYVPREHLGALLQSFTVGVVSLLPGHEGLSVPSKTYGLLAAGCPILGILPAESEIAMMVRETDSGIVVRPGDVDGLVSVLRQMAEAPTQREHWSQQARHTSQSVYALRHVAKAYEAVFANLVGR